MSLTRPLVGQPSATRLLTPSTRRLMRITDIGFITYWTLVALHLVPPRVLFAEYHLATVSAWNWSFLPLDLTASITGLIAIRRSQSHPPSAERLAAVSLLLTSVAGGMALAYWSIRRQFALTWWLPNALLLCFPIPPLTRWLRGDPAVADDGRDRTHTT